MKQENDSISMEIKMINNMILRHVISIMKYKDNIYLTPIQISIMCYINDKKNCVYQKDLEKVFKMRRSTISGILKTMEKNGLIKKSLSSDDSRSKIIVLTEKSIFKARDLNKKGVEFDKLLTENISKEELDVFFKVTSQIKDNLSK